MHFYKEFKNLNYFFIFFLCIKNYCRVCRLLCWIAETSFKLFCHTWKKIFVFFMWVGGDEMLLSWEEDTAVCSCLRMVHPTQSVTYLSAITAHQWRWTMCLDLETQVLQILKIFYSITTEHGIQETVYLGHKIFYTLQFHFRSVKIEKAPIV